MVPAADGAEKPSIPGADGYETRLVERIQVALTSADGLTKELRSALTDLTDARARVIERTGTEADPRCWHCEDLSEHDLAVARGHRHDHPDGNGAPAKPLNGSGVPGLFASATRDAQMVDTIARVCSAIRRDALEVGPGWTPSLLVAPEVQDRLARRLGVRPRDR